MTAMRSPYLQSSGGAGPSPHLTLGEGAKPSGRGRGAGWDWTSPWPPPITMAMEEKMRGLVLSCLGIFMVSAELCPHKFVC